MCLEHVLTVDDVDAERLCSVKLFQATAPATQVTYIVSGGALNSDHLLLYSYLLAYLISVRTIGTVPSLTRRTNGKRCALYQTTQPQSPYFAFGRTERINFL